MNNFLTPINSSTYCVDVLYPEPQHTAAYLIVTDNTATLIDTGAINGEQQILTALAQVGLRADNVRQIFITHAHLDHSGCAGQLMQIFPNAVLYGHPDAIRHIINPNETLVPAVRQLYGEEFFNQHYGQLLPIDSTRTHSLQDDEVISIGNNREIKTIYTPGHAWHHASFYDRAEKTIFCGDAYGISYNPINQGERYLLVPVMPPSQFNPEAMLASNQKILDSSATTAALSHFGTVAVDEKNTQTLSDTLARWQGYAATAWQNPDTFSEKFESALIDDLTKQLKQMGLDATDGMAKHQTDLWLNVRGFEHYLRRQTLKGISLASLFSW